jgi:hypothetical protein
MTRAALLLVLLALALPAPALAQGDAFQPLPPPGPAETPTPEPPDEPSTAIDDEGGRATLYVIGAALVVAFAGLGIAITRDARRRLPGEERDRQRALREEGPHRKGRQAKAKARAKGRAARAARRRAARNR